ncbi:hypothetical protein [Sphingomonas paucimobilis]|uniref:Uncharacterized protein n=1 Tax=Sphingomonas paucimobilis TaxID=13689 RepID=A0A7Y2PDP5_SPHPI|nr:hypothetical protein [Sphingomonas paucimobilis]NNG59784.1 hypothetical protein [Sphingomonas paucimobilis]
MVAGMNRERRVVALEQRKKARGAVSIPMITAELDESSDAAVARYVAEHGPLPVVEDGDVNIIVMVPVALTRWAA